MKYNPEIMKQLDGVISPQSINFIQDMGPLNNRLTPNYLNSVSKTLTELAGVAEKHFGAIGTKDKEMIDVHYYHLRKSDYNVCFFSYRLQN